MSVKIEKKEGSKIELQFNIPNVEFKKAIEKAYEKNAKYFSVPGFRKGKVPKDVAMKYYGEGALFEEAFNLIADEEYKKAIDENNLEIVSEPEVDVKEIGADKDLVYTITLYTKPEATVKKYKGLEIEKVEDKISEEEVTEEIEKNREKNSRVITAEGRALDNKDISVIDFEGFKDGIAFEGGKGEKFELAIGSGQFIPGFEEQLIGMNIGDQRDITVTFPKEYHSEDLKGAEVVFKVKLHEIKAKELPALDDEFAKDISEFTTLAEYKEDLKKKMQDYKTETAKREKENRIMDKLAENTEVEIIPSMVDLEIKDMMKDFEQNLKQQGFDLERYAGMMGTTVEGLKEEFRPEAEKKIKLGLAFEVIEKAEKLEVKQEDIEARVKELVKEDTDKFESYMKNPNVIDYVKNGLRSDMIVKLLVENSIEKK